MTQTAPERVSAHYFALHDDMGTGEVRSLFRVYNGIYQWWTGQDGDAEWSDSPSFAMYGQGEPGARLITEDEAEELKRTLEPPSPGAVAMLAGSPEGRTDLPAPAPDEADDTEVTPAAGESVEDDQ